MFPAPKYEVNRHLLKLHLTYFVSAQFFFQTIICQYWLLKIDPDQFADATMIFIKFVISSQRPKSQCFYFYNKTYAIMDSYLIALPSWQINIVCLSNCKPSKLTVVLCPCGEIMGTGNWNNKTLTHTE